MDLHLGEGSLKTTYRNNIGSALRAIRRKYQDKNDKIIYIKGLVEQTLINNQPEKISLLRLDTDFYESTKSYDGRRDDDTQHSIQIAALFSEELGLFYIYIYVFGLSTIVL